MRPVKYSPEVSGLYGNLLRHKQHVMPLLLILLLFRTTDSKKQAVSNQDISEDLDANSMIKK